MTMPVIALVGNPNAGKTSLFNALSGQAQTVGNWPGVTVECANANIRLGGRLARLVDLPGCYSLFMGEHVPLDSQIACTFLSHESVDVLVNVIDATHVTRHLYLTSQLIEMRIPMLVVLSKMDVQVNQSAVDPIVLERALGCPVIAIADDQTDKCAQIQEGVQGLLRTKCVPSAQIKFAPVIENAIAKLSDVVTARSHISQRLNAIKLLEGDHGCIDEQPDTVKRMAKELSEAIACDQGDPADLLMADARYLAISDWVACAHMAESGSPIGVSMSAKIDRVVLNRWLGLPLFFLVMYLLFTLVIGIGGAVQGLIDHLGTVLLVNLPGQWLSVHHAPSWVISLLTDGLGLALTTTLTFAPVVGLMFWFLSWLEHCGYMSRAAFVTDRLMRAAGLPGKAFVAMIIGLGCNVPAVMATRTLDDQQDRILTAIMTPFMSCSARLAIYAVFVAAFFPHTGGLVIFALYVLGILIALLSGLLLRRTLVESEVRPLVMELPNYQWPKFRPLLKTSWRRLSGFVMRAGKTIVPVSLALILLMHIDLSGRWQSSAQSNTALLTVAAQKIVPVFKPIGIKPDNWPAVSSLVMGVISKEVVIGGLNSLYAGLGEGKEDVEEIQPNWPAFWASIKTDLAQIPTALLHPLASAPSGSLSLQARESMLKRFDGRAGAFAFLVFILLYFPCVSTLAAQRREIGLAWTGFSLFWSTGIAYAASTICYQVVRYPMLPQTAMTNLLITSGSLGGLFVLLRLIGRYSRAKP